MAGRGEEEALLNVVAGEHGEVPVREVAAGARMGRRWLDGASGQTAENERRIKSHGWLWLSLPTTVYCISQSDEPSIYNRRTGSASAGSNCKLSNPIYAILRFERNLGLMILT